MNLEIVYRPDGGDSEYFIMTQSCVPSSIVEALVEAHAGRLNEERGHSRAVSYRYEQTDGAPAALSVDLDRVVEIRAYQA